MSGEEPPAWESAGELAGHKAPVMVGTFTYDGKKLVTSGRDLTIRTWDLQTRKQLNSRNASTLITGLALMEGGKVLAEARAGSVIFTDLDNGEPAAAGSIRRVGDSPAIALGADDTTLAVSGTNGEVSLWDIRRARNGASTPWAVGPHRGDWRLVRGLRVACGGTERTVRVWETRRKPHSAH